MHITLMYSMYYYGCFNVFIFNCCDALRLFAAMYIVEILQCISCAYEDFCPSSHECQEFNVDI